MQENRGVQGGFVARIMKNTIGNHEVQNGRFPDHGKQAKDNTIKLIKNAINTDKHRE